mmetsp:Transcript_50653/g.147348  ORF Transcript_50653/g.147348 Transcript_50653/m.147348 type:complete len:491 (-) Transcript_50653:202-1674(-)
MSWQHGREVVERFATFALTNFGNDCAILCLLPWRSGRKPDDILAPKSLGESGMPKQTDIETATASRHTVLVPCTFEHSEEEVSAHRILPMFTSCEHVCVFIVQLMPEGLVPSRSTCEIIMKRHDAMLATGVDDVFMDPPTDAAVFRRTINLARATWELNVRRMQLMLDAEPDPVSPKAMQALMAQHSRLLWESIPRVLMPHFAPADPHLSETSSQVGQFKLLRRFETCSGTVLQASDEFNNPVAIKVIDKAQVCTPGELEGVYREFRFLSEFVAHPNVVKCLGMLHSHARVFLILEFAGNQNLMQVLSPRPAQRLDEDVALNCFKQVADGLAHCHSVNVCHRSLSLHHVVLNELLGGDVYHCKIVDFHSAMVSKGNTTSRTTCGTLPCIAPEVALGGPYVPHRADCWSAGILLLEMAGGMSTLSRAIPYDPARAEPRQVADSINNFFRKPGSHAQALALIGAVQSQPIVSKLQALLNATPDNRAQMRDVL